MAHGKYRSIRRASLPVSILLVTLINGTRGPRALPLDLSKPEAIAIAKRLAATCDVVIQNFATGVMERLGLGYEELKKAKPDLIMASISGYGQTGPQRQYMGYGPAMGPLSGLSLSHRIY